VLSLCKEYDLNTRSTVFQKKVVLLGAYLVLQFTNTPTIVEIIVEMQCRSSEIFNAYVYYCIRKI